VPKLDDAARGTYFRWSLFAPSVIEPGSMARAGKWEYRVGAAGWGTYEDMITTMESAIEGRDFVLGKEFSMADINRYQPSADSRLKAGPYAGAAGRCSVAVVRRRRRAGRPSGMGRRARVGGVG
jgi:hypothetical protein